jgi:hypothetical protein
MISRLRESPVKVRLDENEVSLDQDFAWQMYLAALYKLGFEPGLVLGSNHTLRALVLVGALQQALKCGESLPILVPPYFLGENGKRLGPEFSMDLLSQRFRKNSIRALVGSSLSWSQKESALQTGQLMLFDKMTDRLDKLPAIPAKANGVEAFLKQCEYRRIRNALASVRRNKGLFDSESLGGVID